MRGCLQHGEETSGCGVWEQRIWRRSFQNFRPMGQVVHMQTEALLMPSPSCPQAQDRIGFHAPEAGELSRRVQNSFLDGRRGVVQPANWLGPCIPHPFQAWSPPA
jgi:hypothetical protein